MDQEIYERLKKISERLKREYLAEKVILFGSYAKGEATEDSDVDLLVIAPAEERFFERMATVIELVRDLYNGLALSPIVLRPGGVEDIEKGASEAEKFIKAMFPGEKLNG